MDTTFTQGKWVAATTPDLSLFVCLDDAEHTVLASLNSVNPYDAKLMAAAPELLEVVKAMATFDGRNNNAALKVMAKDALAKVLAK